VALETRLSRTYGRRIASKLSLRLATTIA
jgi:hypothetical protein